MAAPTPWFVVPHTTVTLGLGHVAVTAAIDRDVRLDPLASGLVLHDYPADAVALADGIHNLAMQKQPDPGLAHELHEEDFPPMGVDADGGRALGVQFMVAGGALFLQALAEFEGEALDDEPVVAVVEAEPGQGGRDAAEKTSVFDQQGVGAVAPGGDGGGETGGAGADDEDLGAE